MVEQGRYAQKGYSYQKDFYTLLVAKMDISKDIGCVEIEKIFSEAEKKIKVYNKKYKKNIAIQKIPANKKNMVTNGGSER